MCVYKQIVKSDKGSSKSQIAVGVFKFQRSWQQKRKHKSQYRRRIMVLVVSCLFILITGIIIIIIIALAIYNDCRKPLVICPNGHSVCAACSSSMKLCPQCRLAFCKDEVDAFEKLEQTSLDYKSGCGHRPLWKVVSMVMFLFYPFLICATLIGANV